MDFLVYEGCNSGLITGTIETELQLRLNVLDLLTFRGEAADCIQPNTPNLILWALQDTRTNDTASKWSSPSPSPFKGAGETTVAAKNANVAL